MSALKADRVEEIFKDCLYRDEELTAEQRAKIDQGLPPAEAIVTEGIVSSTAFNPERLEAHREEIVRMLNELPTEFLSANLGGGGGWSFLNSCMTKDGEQWASFHQTQDRLVQLGMGVKAAKYLMPREMWSIFPGGMPYFMVTEAAA